MADGHLNKCKSCAKEDSKKRYTDPVSRPKIIAYERARWLKPERRLKVAQYLKTMRAKYPGKYKARMKVGNELRSGRLKKTPCWCGDKKVEAHHKDYRKKLQIAWLCRKHHLSAENKQSYN